LKGCKERAWYDNHREQILRGGLGEKLEEDGIDLFQYFTSSCYTGFSDDESGFYCVYHEVFNNIAKEDSEFIDNQDSDVEVPFFGKSTDEYESVVGPFYAFWTSYNTPRSYSWLDKYDTRQGENRWVKRKMEAENKKIRDKAKKERNEVVRNLAQFVRKRDKRVAEYSKKLQERAELNKKKTQEFQKKQKEERRKLFEADDKSYSMHELENQLRQLEGEYTDTDVEESCSDLDETDLVAEELDQLYCVACDRLFRTQGAKENHESSRKHKLNLDTLVAEMNNERASSGNLDEGSDKENIELDDSSSENCQIPLHPQSRSKSKKQKKKQKKKAENIAMKNDNDILEKEPVRNRNDESVDDSDSPVSTWGSKKKSKKQKKKVVNELLSCSEDEKLEDSKIAVLSEDDVSWDGKSKNKSNKSKKKSQKSANSCKSKSKNTQDLGKKPPAGNIAETQPLQNSAVVMEHEEVAIVQTEADEDRSKFTERDYSLSSSKIADVDVPATSKDLSCAHCKAIFPSKNKLFSHLKSTGHAVYLPKEDVNISSSKSKRKNKK